MSNPTFRDGETMKTEDKRSKCSNIKIFRPEFKHIQIERAEFLKQQLAEEKQLQKNLRQDIAIERRLDIESRKEAREENKRKAEEEKFAQSLANPNATKRRSPSVRCANVVCNKLKLHPSDILPPIDGTINVMTNTWIKCSKRGCKLDFCFLVLCQQLRVSHEEVCDKIR